MSTSNAMNLRHAVATAFVALACIGAPAFAASDARKMADDRAETQYKEDMRQCRDMKGNEADVCKKDARARRTAMKADARAMDKGTTGARTEAREDKAKATYAAAKERCDAMSGKDKDACQSQAQADRDRAMAQAQRNR